MVKVYFEKTDLEDLKKEIKGYGKNLLIFTLFCIICLFIEAFYIRQYTFEIFGIIFMGYLAYWIVVTTSLLCTIVGCLFYLGDGEKDHDRVYL